MIVVVCFFGITAFVLGYACVRLVQLEPLFKLRRLRVSLYDGPRLLSFWHVLFMLSYKKHERYFACLDELAYCMNFMSHGGGDLKKLEPRAQFLEGKLMERDQTLLFFREWEEVRAIRFFSDGTGFEVEAVAGIIHTIKFVFEARADCQFVRCYLGDDLLYSCCGNETRSLFTDVLLLAFELKMWQRIAEENVTLSFGSRRKPITEHFVSCAMFMPLAKELQSFISQLSSLREMADDVLTPREYLSWLGAADPLRYIEWQVRSINVDSKMGVVSVIVQNQSERLHTLCFEIRGYGDVRNVRTFINSRELVHDVVLLRDWRPSVVQLLAIIEYEKTLGFVNGLLFLAPVKEALFKLLPEQTLANLWRAEDFFTVHSLESDVFTSGSVLKGAPLAPSIEAGKFFASWYADADLASAYLRVNVYPVPGGKYAFFACVPRGTRRGLLLSMDPSPLIPDTLLFLADEAGNISWAHDPRSFCEATLMDLSYEMDFADERKALRTRDVIAERLQHVSGLVSCVVVLERCTLRVRVTLSGALEAASSAVQEIIHDVGESLYSYV